MPKPIPLPLTTRLLVLAAAAICLHAIPTSRPAHAQANVLAEAVQLSAEAIRLHEAGQTDEAIVVARRVVVLLEQARGPHHRDVAQSLYNLAAFLQAKREFAAAEALIRRALAIDEKTQPPNPIAVALGLHNLASLLQEKGDLAGAEPLYRRSLALREKTLGPDHPDVAMSLNYLASLLQDQGDYAAAVPLLRRELAIREKTVGPDHPDVATNLNNLATLLRSHGDYAAAELLHRRAIGILEKAFGPDHPEVAAALNALASLLRITGDYAAAEPLHRRALAIQQKALGPDHPAVAKTLGSLALLLEAKGDLASAEPYARRALAVDQKAFGPDHLAVAASLNILASVLQDKGDHAGAEPLYRRALAIREKNLGPEHPVVATSLNNLALLLQAKGDVAAAEPLYRRALAIQAKTFGPDHGALATGLNNLALLLKAKGEYAAAVPLYRRALALLENSLGPGHPNVAKTLSNLAALLQAQGKPELAVPLLARAQAIHDRHLDLLLAVGSEAQKQTYLSTLDGETDATVSLHADALPADPAAARLALETLLRRKARALDAMAQTLGALRAHAGPAERKLLEERSALLGRIATLTYRGPGNQHPLLWRKEVADLAAEAQRLEVDLAGRSAAFAASAQPITLLAVRAAIPADGVLVEIAAYQPLDHKAKAADRWGKRRYVAYLLRRTGDPVLVQLGDADALDAKALVLRQALAATAPLADVKTAARAVDAALLGPLRPGLGTATHVLVSPDGPLGMLPFAALVDAAGRFAVETLDITYLSSGRDLLRLQTRVPARGKPLVLAAPDYGPIGKAANSGDGSANAVSREMRRGSFGPLAGTKAEAEALQPLLPDAQVLIGPAATEAAVKAVRGPAVLHLATHGYFLEGQRSVDALAGTRGAEPMVDETGTQAPRPLPVGWENPLLRSGLALANANRPTGQGDDGLLTALEAAGLDLSGTRLVVLSACQTGLGEARDGQGVFGLRRALVLAGAETVVMSLWNVDDDATQDLMVAWYRRLVTGQGRGDALRTVQLEMLAGKRGEAWRHPAYWSAFVGSGEWRGM